MKLNENAKVIVILIVIILGSLLCISLPIMFKVKLEYIIEFFLGYVVIFVILSTVANKMDNSILKKIAQLFSLPLSIIYLILRIGLPTVVLLLNAIFLFLLTFGIPVISMVQIETIFEIGLKRPTMIFLAMTFASISAVYISKYLLKFILKWSSVTMDSYRERFQELTTLFYHKNNILFFIYACYFIYLGITAFLKVQCGIPFFSIEIDIAILQSFLVFLAFSNMISKFQDVRFAPQAILILYAKIIFGDKKKEEQT
ncbi:MAG: hypothetical protein LBT29_06705 [Flavobacteriaceae bacterium]|jgi:hypothetical protein|nr:hypothetical protein [Flavobacteriaceae bacterium]